MLKMFHDHLLCIWNVLTCPMFALFYIHCETNIAFIQQIQWIVAFIITTLLITCADGPQTVFTVWLGPSCKYQDLQASGKSCGNQPKLCWRLWVLWDPNAAVLQSSHLGFFCRWQQRLFTVWSVILCFHFTPWTLHWMSKTNLKVGFQEHGRFWTMKRDLKSAKMWDKEKERSLNWRVWWTENWWKVDWLIRLSAWNCVWAWTPTY